MTHLEIAPNPRYNARMLKIPTRINLYSDTQTRPTPAMRDAMARAECGDEQNFDDPTVNTLCERVAALLGKEDAVFLPSGTMCNEIAILVQVPRGEEIIAHETAHIICSEGGGPAALAGAMIRPLKGDRGQFDAADVTAAVRHHPSRYEPRTRMLEVEQTANLGGGSVWPLARISAVAQAAKARGLVTHMDGARLMNAVVASGVAARDFALHFDTVWIDFTKGLGARWARCWRGRSRSSPKPGAGSSAWGVRCARPASSPPAACTGWITTSIAWRMITPTRKRSRATWRRFRAWR